VHMIYSNVSTGKVYNLELTVELDLYRYDIDRGFCSTQYNYYSVRIRRSNLTSTSP